MFRYVAFVWHQSDPGAAQHSRVLARRLQDWQCVLRGNRLEVYCRDIRPRASEPYWLHGETGVVLGKLFGAKNSSASTGFSESESAKIVGSAGRHLIDHYWGRYVAFLQEADTVWVLRDPAGLQPCLTMHTGGVDVYFSHMDEGVL